MSESRSCIERLRVDGSPIPQAVSPEPFLRCPRSTPKLPRTKSSSCRSECSGSTKESIYINKHPREVHNGEKVYHTTVNTPTNTNVLECPPPLTAPANSRQINFVVQGQPLHFGRSKTTVGNVEANKTPHRAGSFKTSQKKMYRATHFKQKNCANPDDNKQTKNDALVSRPLTPKHKHSETTEIETGLRRENTMFVDFSYEKENSLTPGYHDLGLAFSGNPHSPTRCSHRSRHDSHLSSAVNRFGDPEQVKQCLFVHHANHRKRDDHEIKMNYINTLLPNRQVNSVLQKRKANKPRENYQFSNIDSYVHFNSLYKTLNKGNSVIPPGLMRLPNPHSDTLLLELIHRMNRPFPGLESMKTADIPANGNDRVAVSTETDTLAGKLPASVRKMENGTRISNESELSRQTVNVETPN